MQEAVQMGTNGRTAVRRETVRDSLAKTLTDVVGQPLDGGFGWTAEKLNSQDAFGGPGLLRILLSYMTLEEVDVIHRWDRMHRAACKVRVRRSGLFVRSAPRNDDRPRVSGAALRVLR